ncbi:hypothetical protein JOF28_002321 [Leucobacter exalbidus]|uniref:Ig-like domain-containing protein n=1 Tax=Leucobacter exalbidus TaxID=662960 RepID=A0A940T4R3_9MICO|nr:HtaA domain-containing protein [Leucobacter exalbidus]MBP1327089.1 hypothetical protein [Leucobacter exalbidus]
MTAQKNWRKKFSSLLATGTAALIAVTGLVAVPVAAQAAPMAVETATFDWGVKTSFREYISGTIAGGTVTPLGNTDSTLNGAIFRWTGGVGNASAAGDTADLNFTGDNGVRFVGHHGVLDVSITNPRIEVTSASTAKLYVDADGLNYNNENHGQPYSYDGVYVADMTLTAPVIVDGVITWTNAPATLVNSPEALNVFAGFYGGGVELDPITFSTGPSKDTAPIETTPTVTTQPKALTVPAGTAAVFTAEASGQPAPTVQWQADTGKGWTNISGATSKKYTVSKVRASASVAKYRAIFTNTAGEAKSGTARLTVAANATTTTVAFTPTTFGYNVAKTAKVTVKSARGSLVPAGSVAMKINGATYKAKLTGGKASIKLTKPANAGSRAVSVAYTSNVPAEFKNSTGSTKVKITKVAPKVTATFAKSRVTKKQNATVKVTVSVPGTLKAKASKVKVQVFDGSKKIKSATLNSQGKVNVKLPKLKAGSHKIKVKVVGNSNLKSKYSSVRKLTVK